MGIAGPNVQAGGGRVVMVVGQKVWEEWTGRTVEEMSSMEEAGQEVTEGDGANISEEVMEYGLGARQGV